MEFLNHPWLEILLGSVLLLGILLGVVLLVNKYPSSKWLGLLCLLYVGLAVLSQFGLSSWFSTILVVFSAIFQNYIKSFFQQRTRVNWLLLIPSLIPFLWLLITEIDHYLFQIISRLIGFGYLYMTLQTLRQESLKRGFTWFGDPGARLIWLRNFASANLLFTASLLIYPVADFWSVAISIIGLMTYIVYQIINESTFLSPIPISNKYQKSTLSPAIKSSILEKLDRVFEVDNFHLRDDASLGNLAKELGATTHHLSQVLNESKQISFQDLIAQYRIRTAMQLLRKPTEQQTKIENIAMMVGYNSKSAFNTAFKKRTGQTPSEFRDQKNVRTYGEERLPERERQQWSLSAFLLNHVFILKMNNDMIQHFFTTFYRNLKRNRLFSFLNILGLVVGFTCSMLIYLYMSDELSYDKEIQDYKQIHRIAWNNEIPQTRTPHPMAQAMVESFPEVEHAVSISPWYGSGLSKENVRVKNVATNILFDEPDFYFTDSTFLDVFQLEVLEGDKDALKKPFSLVITEPMARKYFGNESAIGKELEVSDMPIAVSAVVAPLPEKSHFHFNAIISYVTLKQINPTDSWMKWEDFGHFNYIKLANGTDVDALERKIPEWVLSYLDWDQSDSEALMSGIVSFGLQPIADIHLHSKLKWELEANGDIMDIYVLSAILFFLILIACINYVNLTTSKSIERAKEVGVRKTLGAASQNLSLQFYAESILFSLCAGLISIVLTLLLLDLFNGITGKHLEFSLATQWVLVLQAIGFSIFIGLLAGFYPSTILSSFKPADVLKGKLTAQSEGVRLRGLLVVVQFAISAVLIAASLIVFDQIEYMRDKDLGFNQEAIITINIPSSVEYGGINLPAVRTVQEKIETLSGVVETSMMSNIPGGQFNQHPYFEKSQPDNKVNLTNIMVDYDIDQLLGLKVTKGRMFNRSFSSDSTEGFVINEAAAQQLNLENPIGKTLVFDGAGPKYEGKIIGIVNDFHYKSLHNEIQPLIMTLDPMGANHMLVKIEGNQFGTIIESIEEYYGLLNKDLPFTYHFLDDQLAELYNDEIQTLNTFATFTVIALLLACLGLLGMSIATLNQRIKEIGMRKILGASTFQIMTMVVGQFLKLVVIALFIGLPIAYFLMQQWLSEFSYQSALGFMPFLWSMVILIAVAIISVSSAVAKLSLSQPVDSLRCE